MFLADELVWRAFLAEHDDIQRADSPTYRTPERNHHCFCTLNGGYRHVRNGLRETPALQSDLNAERLHDAAGIAEGELASLDHRRSSAVHLQA